MKRPGEHKDTHRVLDELHPVGGIQSGISTRTRIAKHKDTHRVLYDLHPVG